MSKEIPGKTDWTKMKRLEGNGLRQQVRASLEQISNGNGSSGAGEGRTTGKTDWSKMKRLFGDELQNQVDNSVKHLRPSKNIANPGEKPAAEKTRP